MPRAHTLLLGAYRRYGGREDPLTELMATAISAWPPFGRALFDHAGVELARPERLEAVTQVRTHEDRRVDLEVVGLDEQRNVVGRVWSENKTGGTRYQPDQLGSYRRSLERLGGDWRLITIVPHPSEASPDAAALGVPVLTWQDIATIAWAAGRESPEGSAWRRLARSPEAGAGLRTLEEFISYLEEEHDVTIEPVTFEHVRAFQLANQASDMITGLLGRAADYAHGWVRRGDVGWNAREDWGHYWQVFEGGPEWLTRAGGYLELQVADSDDWSRDRIGQPAVGAGATLPAALYEALRAQPAFADSLAAAGFSLGLDGMTRIYRTIYLAELTGRGPTLDTQARWLSDWLVAAFTALATVAAPQLAPT